MKREIFCHLREEMRIDRGEEMSEQKYGDDLFASVKKGSKESSPCLRPCYLNMYCVCWASMALEIL